MGYKNMENQNAAQELNKIGNKLSDEAQSENSTNLNKELEGLNSIMKDQEKEKKVIQIKEKDIEFLQGELDITFEEAKAFLIKHEGSIDNALTNFINDFRFS